jgi:hypothetical protein
VLPGSGVSFTGPVRRRRLTKSATETPGSVVVDIVVDPAVLGIPAHSVAQSSTVTPGTRRLPRDAVDDP